VPLESSGAQNGCLRDAHELLAPALALNDEGGGARGGRGVDRRRRGTHPAVQSAYASTLYLTDALPERIRRGRNHDDPPTLRMAAIRTRWSSLGAVADFVIGIVAVTTRARSTSSVVLADTTEDHQGITSGPEARNALNNEFRRGAAVQLRHLFPLPFRGQLTGAGVRMLAIRLRRSPTAGDDG
jgi:hypothetical protein